jgi:indolepyruvate ferredoxin oxidoreductase beta subunit
MAVSPQRPIKSAATPSAPTNVLVVGVGGQGVIMISKVLAQLCQQQGYQVKQSEVHGMAKRGGVVFSHVRFGEKVWSPTIPQGEADVLLAMEWAEGLRWLSYLHPQRGIFIADMKQIPPPFAYRERQRGAASGYHPESVADLTRRLPNSLAIDATGMAKRLGNERVANTIVSQGRVAGGAQKLCAAQDHRVELSGVRARLGMGHLAPGSCRPRGRRHY